MTTITYAAGTDVGHARRQNEDRYCIDEGLGLALVADGMGGHACGDVASEITANTIRDCVAAGDRLNVAIQKAHTAIIDSARQGIGKAGMGSTVVAVHFSGADYNLAWVGDSRAYLWNGELNQISRDHSLVQMLIDSDQITDEEAKTHPSRSTIYNNLGAPFEKVEVEEINGTLQPGQKLLLCSDGLSDEIDSDTIAGIMANGTSDQAIADSLIKTVLEGRAKDNVTVVVVSANG